MFLKKIKYVILVFLVIAFTGILFLVMYNLKNMKDSSRWEDRLYVPTMIQKIENTYFIMDCWNHRVIYNTNLSKDVSEWKTLTDDDYIGGHTIASDGKLYVLDNTDHSEVLVYKKDGDEFVQSQIIESIDGRPHYVVYDEKAKLFYVIGSTLGTIYVLKNNDGNLELVRTDVLDEIVGSYVRSISIIDGYLYTTSGPGYIYEYEITADGFNLHNTYAVPDELFGMNQMTKIGDFYYLTVNTNKSGDLSYTSIVRTKDLTELSAGGYENLYDQMGFVGQPYYISNFDGKYWIGEISATKGNGIKSFMVDENKVKNVKKLFYWDDVIAESEERYQSKYPSVATETEQEVEKVDLFIFSGQSNMSGKGDATLAPDVTHGYEFRAISDPTTLYSITEPFGLNENNPKGINDTWIETGELRKLGGLVSSFANSYYSITGVPVVGVSCSEGATKIDGWIPGTDRYNDIVNRCSLAKDWIDSSGKYSISHIYFVWCQGESDGDEDTTAQVYYNSLEKLTSTLVNEGVVDKCMIIRIGNSGTNATKYDEIISAQTSLCQDSDNCILISTRFAEMSSTGLMKDEYHYTQEGYNLVGKEAGYNAGLYTKMGTEPSLFDYESQMEYNNN